MSEPSEAVNPEADRQQEQSSSGEPSASNQAGQWKSASFKTVLPRKSSGDQSPENASQASPQGGLTGFERLVKKVGPVVVKTMLDPEAMRNVMARLAADNEIRLQGAVSAPRPFEMKKCVEKFRRASSCDPRWENMAGSGKARFCEKCNLQVYDFADMDDAEAQDLIFQREGRKEVTLFRRKDGKFLTRDCPVGVKTKTLLVAAAAASVLLVGVAVMIVSSMPANDDATPPNSSRAQAGGPHGNEGESDKTEVISRDDTSINAQQEINEEQDPDLIEAEQQRQAFERAANRPEQLVIGAQYIQGRHQRMLSAPAGSQSAPTPQAGNSP